MAALGVRAFRRLAASGRPGLARSRGRRAAVTVRAGWNDFEWKPATVARTSAAAEGLVSVSLELGPEAVAAYTRPGQFVQLRTSADGKPAFIAIASAPGEHPSEVELLIKALPGTTAAEVAALPPGAAVEASPVMGKGFVLDDFAPEDAPDVLLFATGSGISPVKALIEATAAAGGLRASERGGAVRLYYGVRDKGHMAFSDRVEQWEAAGVTVVPVYSESGEGYVQDVLAKEAEGGATYPGAVAVLCGQKEMAEAVKEVLGGQGVPPEKFVTNF